MTQSQNALLDRLRELVEETPKSGAVNAAKRPLHVTRFSQAIETRAEDGEALVKYTRSKVYAKPTIGYAALIAAGRPDLTVEAVVADADAPWADEFSDADRATAKDRLGNMIETHRQNQAAAEADAVTYDRKIAAQVSANRVAKGLPSLTPEQEATMLKGRAAKRSDG